MKFEDIKTHINKMHEVLLAVPDNLMIGPLTDYKKEFRKLSKDIRRGRTSYLQIGQEKATQAAGENEKLQAAVEKIQGFIMWAVETKKKYDEAVAPLVKAIQFYVAAKTALTLAAELTEKINEIAAVTPVGVAANPLGPVMKAVAWFQKLFKKDGEKEVNKAAKYLRQWNLIEWWWLGVPKGAYGLHTWHPDKTPQMQPKEFQPGFLHKSFLYPIMDMLDKFKLAQVARLNRAKKWGGETYLSVADAIYYDEHGDNIEDIGGIGDLDVMSDEDLIAMLEGDDVDTGDEGNEDTDYG